LCISEKDRVLGGFIVERNFRKIKCAWNNK